MQQVIPYNLRNYQLKIKKQNLSFSAVSILWQKRQIF